MSDNKKKRIGKVLVPQKPSKAPEKSIIPDRIFVPQKPSKAPEKLNGPNWGFAPPGLPKPPPR